ncbi:ABC transporter ATP-binding protein [Pelagibius litoralis]|uniref:ABC transporter ATP-binding protein n=1 Tax=Pelagibius litoralis TaxID=374515 RepID=A0A967EZU9_9PROT|nr:ABC transporter ATP-binding protein [Pelagibius litoralis]NIA70435.1 ABC transporter ATP-binding protein [Pelagibius litoralis]
MSDPVLEISGLEVTFPGLVRSTTILRSIDMRIDAGDVLGLVGESGCGKSMTALACLGMVPAPGSVSGGIKVDGYEVVGRSDAELGAVRGSKAAMIFQNPMRSLNPFFSVGRQMTEIIRLHRSCDKADAYMIAMEELTSVHMPDPDFALSKYPHQLSGGQIQRVMIALALACRPKLLIADEPTTALDVTVQAQIISLLRELADKTGLTILFITHDLGVVSQLCNRVAVMYAGRIVETGSVEDVIDNPRHPYAAKLMNTVPTIGHGLRDLDSIPGQVPDPAFPPPGCAFHDRCALAIELCSQTIPRTKVMAGAHEVACHRAGDIRDAAKVTS